MTAVASQIAQEPKPLSVITAVYGPNNADPRAYRISREFAWKKQGTAGSDPTSRGSVLSLGTRRAVVRAIQNKCQSRFVTHRYSANV